MQQHFQEANSCSVRFFLGLAAVGAWILLTGCSQPSSELAERLTEYIKFQVADKEIPGFSIALVDGQDVVYAKGFGQERDGVPASPETVYRVGSVSKIYTDIAVMQLVEQGKLDLDAPIVEYLPEFHHRGEGVEAITLRHLMAHRSGLVREPPVGNYFDDSEPAISDIVESLADTDLVYPVGSRERYSNAAIVVVGAVVQAVAGKPFVDHMRDAVLQPLGMATASFARTPQVERHAADGLMWSYDGREFPAPTFEVLVPAGNLYSSVLDQAELIKALNRGGDPILAVATLNQMFEPQFEGRFGLGFGLSEFEGRRSVGHSGAVYGFSSDLQVLPDEKIGVVSAASRDVTNDTVRRVNDYALRLLLASREGKPLPDWDPSEPADLIFQKQVEGTYRSEDLTIRLVRRDGDLWSEGVPFHRVPIRRSGEGYVFDGRLTSGLTIDFSDDVITISDKRYERAESNLPALPPKHWAEVIGEYGWPHNTLFILERYGQLCALIEWVFLYPLTEASPDLFAFPDYGLYHGEEIVVERDSSNQVTGVRAASILFPRLPTAEAGSTFKIEPLKPVEELRQAALAAKPPEQPEGLLASELVDLAELDPTIRLDIRYASTNNFMRAQFYPEPRALMQRPAAEALVRAHQELAKLGYGLLIHDAYRPWYVTKMFWDATPDSMKDFVANPANGSIHNRGAAVDLTLYDRATGEAVEMPSGYDEFSERAYPDYVGGTSRQRWLRELLRSAMEEQGFSVNSKEWWHFDHGDALRYPVLNLRHGDMPQTSTQ